MKTRIWIILLCSIFFGNSFAQEIKKELQTDQDGFQWVELTQGKLKGAEDPNGKTLIPLAAAFESIRYYHNPSQDRGFFYLEKNNIEAVFDKTGKEIISASRGYSTVIYQINLDGYKYFEVRRGDLSGACNLAGKEIIPTKYYAVIYNDEFVTQDTSDSKYVYTGIKLSKKDIIETNSSFKQKRNESNGFEWYIVFEGDKCGAEDKDGKVIIPTSRKYDKIEFESNTFSHYPYFLVTKNGKKGVCDLLGQEVLSPIYESIFALQDGFSVSTKKDEISKDTNIKFDEEGHWHSDNHQHYAANEPAASSPTKDLFNQAYNTPDSNVDEKIRLYTEVIRADVNNREGLQALAYNNLGVLGENIGDLKNAQICYERAIQIDPNYQTAKDNLKALKQRNRSQKWAKIGNALGTFGQIFGGINNAQAGDAYNTEGTGTYNTSGGSGGSSDQRNCPSCNGSGKCSASGWADKYRCHGSKKCMHCNGTGIMHQGGQTFTCTTCHGTKKCHYCNGTGNCPTCNGTGKR